MSQGQPDRKRSGSRVGSSRFRCPACRYEFTAPDLGDVSYGEFLLYGERGRAVRYLAAINNSTWDMMVELCPGPHSTPTGRPLTDRLHWVIARLADPVDGEQFLMRITCPLCFTKVVNRAQGENVGWLDVPAATYEGFLSRSPAERKALVESLSRDFNAGAGPR